MESVRRLTGIATWSLLVFLFAIFELEWRNNEPYLGAPVSKWVLLFLLLAATPVLVSIVRAPVCALLRRWERGRPESERLGPDAIRGLGGSSGLLAVSLVWLLIIDPLDLPKPVAIFTGAEVALIIGASWLVLGIWEVICLRVAVRAGEYDSRAEKLLIPLIRKFVRGMILVAGGLVALSAFAVDWKSMVAGLGISGLLVALAAKDSVENLFGSVTILFDMPFQIGDLVKVSGIEGTVEEINLRSTRIRTGEDAVVTLPNSNLIKASVENFGARRRRRERVTMHVPNKTTPAKLKLLLSGIRDYLADKDWVVQGSSVVEVQDFGEVSISIMILFFVQTSSYNQEMQFRGEVLSHCLALAESLEIPL